MRPLDPRLLRHARAVRTLIIASVAISTASALCVIAQAVLLARVVADAVTGDGAPLRGPLIWLGAAILTRAALGWAAEEVARRSAVRMTAQLRRALLQRAVAAGPRWSQRHRASELVTLCTSGIDSLDAYASRYLPQLVLSCIIPVSMLAWLATADLLSTLIVALTLPLVPVFMALVGWHTERQTRRRLRSLEVLSGHFLDVIRGLPILKVFGPPVRRRTPWAAPPPSTARRRGPRCGWPSCPRWCSSC